MVGLSLSATVVQQSLRTQLRAQLSYGGEADRIAQKVRESLEYIKTLEPETRDIVRGCYEIATRNGFTFILGVVSLATLSSCALSILYELYTKANIQYKGLSRRRSSANKDSPGQCSFILLLYHFLAPIRRSIGSQMSFLLGTK